MTKKHEQLTADELKAKFIYYPETGLFHWGPQTKRDGERVGFQNGGYWKISIRNYPYTVHRLAWLYMTGKWPAKLIDHINGNPLDNRWENLREANWHENRRNSRAAKSVTGYKGVAPYNKGRFAAHIYVHGENVFLGTFDTAKEAAIAYDVMAIKHFGPYARLNCPDVTRPKSQEFADAAELALSKATLLVDRASKLIRRAAELTSPTTNRELGHEIARWALVATVKAAEKPDHALPKENTQPKLRIA